MQDPNQNRLPRNPFSGGGDKNDKNEKGGNSRRPRVPTWFVGLLLVCIAVWYAYQFMSPSSDQGRVTVPYSVAVQQIGANNVSKAVVGTSNLEIDLKAPVRWDGDKEVVVPNDAANASSFRDTSNLKANIPPLIRQDNQELIALMDQHERDLRRQGRERLDPDQPAHQLPADHLHHCADRLHEPPDDPRPAKRLRLRPQPRAA